jgi:type IV secretion system protein VirB5
LKEKVMSEERPVLSRALALIAAAAPMTLFAPRPAPAQWAVVDAPAIVQLVQEVQTMQQEVQTARDQLTQANHALQTMTGGRGMQLLLAGTVRNYLPVSWPQLADAMRGASGGYPTLASDVRSAVLDNAVLTAQQLASLSAGNRDRINAARQTGAAQQAVAREALSNSSGRFTALQALIAAIPTASDQKGILDLQARIGAELAMLQNEQTKLQILHQGMLAQQSVNQERERELAIAEQGNFTSRFRPTL